MHHITSNDGSEPLCGQPAWKAAGHTITATLHAAHVAKVDCKRCLAHHACHTGTATNADRLLLAHAGVLPENAGRMFGPIERDTKGRLTRMVWRLEIPGEIPTHAQREAVDAYNPDAADVATLAWCDWTAERNA